LTRNPSKRCIIISFLILVSILGLVTPVSANSTIHVYYAGPRDNGVYTALTLAPKGTFSLVADLSLAEVFVLNGAIPDADEIGFLVQSGAGLVLIFGPDISANDVEKVSGVPMAISERNDAVSLTEIKVSDPLINRIIWNGAPQIRERDEINTPLSSVQPLVNTYESGAWILWSG
jgi:hypothetical protein